MVALKKLLDWKDGYPRLRIDRADSVVEEMPALEEEVVERVIIPWVLDD